MSFLDKLSYRRYKVGDRVTVKESDKSYDNAPPITPGMIGTIKSFPPKVCKVKGPLYDSGDYFAYIVFDKLYSIDPPECPVHRCQPIRAGIDICNLKKVRDK